MRTNASAVANYFIEIAQKEGTPIRPLGLMKRVYIAHGFSMAIFDKSALDSRFDTVEAWKFGPVIPSIYHSFKHYGGNPITEKTTFFDIDPNDGELKLQTPELKDDDIKAVCDMVWKRYKSLSDSELVSMLHADGTPWQLIYEPGKNKPIPDKWTRRYYELIVEHTK